MRKCVCKKKTDIRS